MIGFEPLIEETLNKFPMYLQLVEKTPCVLDRRRKRRRKSRREEDSGMERPNSSSNNDDNDKSNRVQIYYFNDGNDNDDEYDNNNENDDYEIENGNDDDINYDSVDDDDDDYNFRITQMSSEVRQKLIDKENLNYQNGNILPIFNR
jgi:hypothetical protein